MTKSRIVGEYARSRYEDCYDDMHKETLAEDNEGFFLLIEDRESGWSRSVFVIMSLEDAEEWCSRHAIQLYTKKAA